MSGEVVRIDNMYLAILIKEELEKKGIEKDESLGFQQFKKEELEQIEDLKIINKNIGKIDELNNIDEKEFKERNNEKERLDRESGEKRCKKFWWKSIILTKEHIQNYMQYYKCLVKNI